MEQYERPLKGTLKVSENVIMTISKLAAQEVEGVARVVEDKNTLKNLIFRQNDSSAVKIRFDGDVVEISLAIVVKSGINAVSVCEQIQDKVKSSVQSMTGVTVSTVNVNVAGVVFDEDTD